MLDLCTVTVLSVRETLHLIPVSEMLEIDPVAYKDYKYCALKDARKHRKDAKLQFVALIASKPELTDPNTLTWKVVDRSGERRKLLSDVTVVRIGGLANAITYRRGQILLQLPWACLPAHVGLGSWSQTRRSQSSSPHAHGHFARTYWEENSPFSITSNGRDHQGRWTCDHGTRQRDTLVRRQD